MIYTTCIMFYAIFSHGRAKSTKVLIALLVVLLAVFITLYYHYLKDPLFQQNMFALLTAIVAWRSLAENLPVPPPVFEAKLPLLEPPHCQLSISISFSLSFHSYL